MPRTSGRIAFGLAPFVESLTAIGIDAESVLSRAGIHPRSLVDPDGVVTLDQEIAFLRILAHLDLPRDFALTVGSHYHASSYGVLGIAMMTSATLGDAYEVAFKHRELIWTRFNFQFEVGPDEAELILEPSAEIPDSCTQILIERDFSSFKCVSDELLGQSLSIERLELSYKPDGPIEHYKRMFGCSVRTGSARNVLTISRADIDRPLPKANPAACKLFTSECARAAAAVSTPATWKTRVRQRILSANSELKSFETIARELHTTPRTLRRRLVQEGTNYRKLARELRMEIADRFIQETDMTLEEIALRVGYESAAALSHAYKKTFETAPRIGKGLT